MKNLIKAVLVLVLVLVVVAMKAIVFAVSATELPDSKRVTQINREVR